MEVTYTTNSNLVFDFMKNEIRKCLLLKVKQMTNGASTHVVAKIKRKVSLRFSDKTDLNRSLTHWINCNLTMLDALTVKKYLEQLKDNADKILLTINVADHLMNLSCNWLVKRLNENIYYQILKIYTIPNSSKHHGC